MELVWLVRMILWWLIFVLYDVIHTIYLWCIYRGYPAERPGNPPSLIILRGVWINWGLPGLTPALPEHSFCLSSFRCFRLSYTKLMEGWRFMKHGLPTARSGKITSSVVAVCTKCRYGMEWGFTSHSTWNRSFRRRFPSQSLGSVLQCAKCRRQLRSCL